MATQEFKGFKLKTKENYNALTEEQKNDGSIYFVEDNGGGSSGGSDTSVYDRVIRTQEEFEALIASEDWLGAKSVAFIGDGGTLEFNADTSVTIPVNVKNIQGFNDAVIYMYDDTSINKFGYDTLPTDDSYSITDLKVISGTGLREAYGFYNCTNLINCIGLGNSPGATGYGFYNCTNLINCKGRSDSPPATGYGFYNCTNLVNCTGIHAETGYGFQDCSYLSNCQGTLNNCSYVDSETCSGAVSDIPKIKTQAEWDAMTESEQGASGLVVVV